MTQMTLVTLFCRHFLKVGLYFGLPAAGVDVPLDQGGFSNNNLIRDLIVILAAPVDMK